MFFRFGHPGHIFSLKNDPAIRRFNQPQDRQAGGGLAATALTDDSEGFSLLERKRDAVDRIDIALGAGENSFGNRKCTFKSLTVSSDSNPCFLLEST